MSGLGETRADVTRQAILDAAAHQFARRSFTDVNMDDIVADTNVSKGALYFHFQSKQSLALAIIEHHAAAVRATTMELLTHQLSGLETMIEITFMVAVLDGCDVYARASMNLGEVVRSSGGSNSGLVDEWAKGSTTVLEQAMADGDVRPDVDPEALSHVLIGHYVGMRQISDLDDATAFITNVENSWRTTLPGFANSDRIGYLTQFIERRAAMAIRGMVARNCSV